MTPYLESSFYIIVLRNGLVIFSWEFTFLLKLEKNIPFPLFSPSTSSPSVPQISKWFEPNITFTKKLFLFFFMLSWSLQTKSCCTNYSTQDKVKLSQKPVSTTLDIPEINFVHAAVKLLESITSYKYILIFSFDSSVLKYFLMQIK